MRTSLPVLLLCACACACACAPPGASSIVRGPLLAPAGKPTQSLVSLCTNIDARPVADRILVALSGELVRRKLATYDEVRDRLASPLQICVTAKPYPCCSAGGCRGPCKMVHGLQYCARKAGCTDGWSVWASALWPPLCDSRHRADPAQIPSWPDEPHCVKTRAEQRTRDVRGQPVWHGALAAELTNVVKGRILHEWDADHGLRPGLYQVAYGALP